MRRLKTLRRPPIYPKTPGHLPCSSLTHPLPLSSRRPSVSFGGFGLKLNMDIYLRRMLEDRERDSEYVGMDFPNALPLADIAQAMGVSSLKVEDPDALQRLAEEAIASGKPSLLDISIDGAL